MTNIKLSPHFKLYEFCNTSSGANVIQANREYASEPANVKKLTKLATNILEPIRAEMIKSFGVKFMTITSGVRTAGTKIANASKTSQHNHCEAADFIITGNLSDSAKLFSMITEGKITGLNLKDVSQVILERKLRPGGKSWSTWIHIGLKTDRLIKQRKEAKRNILFPEFMVSLNGFTYAPSSEKIIMRYIDAEDYDV